MGEYRLVNWPISAAKSYEHKPRYSSDGKNVRRSVALLLIRGRGTALEVRRQTVRLLAQH